MGWWTEMSHIICYCETCEEPIYEGDRVYEIGGALHHEKCIDDMSTVDLIYTIDITNKDILDLLDITVTEAEDDTDAVKAEYEEDFFRYYE
jgi:alkyl hydroperoxide reductase subunit AhpF